MKRYTIRVHDEEDLDRVIEAIPDRRDTDRGAGIVWLITGKSAEEISLIPGVKSVVISHDQSGVNQ